MPGFQVAISFQVLLLETRTTCVPHLILLYLIVFIMPEDQYALRSSCMRNLLHLLFPASLLLLRHLFLMNPIRALALGFIRMSTKEVKL